MVKVLSWAEPYVRPTLLLDWTIEELKNYETKLT